MKQLKFGEAPRRVEDDRLVIGNGTYTDDISLPNQAYAFMVRSTLAHGKIASIDVSDAKTAKSVLGVYSGVNLRDGGLGSIPCAMLIPNKDGSDGFSPLRPVFAVDRVRYVGDTIAMVVAESALAARDAAELISVDYTDLDPVIDMEKAACADAPVIWEGFESNIAVDWEIGDEAETEALFARAAHVTSLKLVNNRVVVCQMEPRSALASFDPQTEQFTLYVGSQGVHVLRDFIAVFSLNIPKENLRLITLEGGGSFGMKQVNFPEYAAILWASRMLNRPVKWTGERVDSFITDTQGRDHISECALALDEEGKILAIRTCTIAGLGGYLSQYGPVVPTLAASGMQTGVYDIPSFYTSVRGVVTNTVPTDAYRGAGRPEVSYVMERLIEKAAYELEIDPFEMRRRNFIRPEQMPHTTIGGLNYDSGRFEETMKMAREASDWDSFPRRAQNANSRDKLMGRGISYYVERTGGGPESAQIKVQAAGGICFAVGTQSNGQGHETAFTQLISEWFGVPFDQIHMEQGDTNILESGGGTGGSKSLIMGSIGLDQAKTRVVEEGKMIAAKEFDVVPDDIVFEDGTFRLPGTNRNLGLFDAARIAQQYLSGAEGLAAVASVQHDVPTFPNGCHICEVEIDRDTGGYEITRYTVVDDFGRIFNPLLVEGQVVGGIAQGLGQAMGEHVVYDNSGQLLSGSFTDYWIPRAADLPDFNVGTNDVPCTTNLLGIKGCGEAGTVGAPAAFVNAVLDALRPLGVRHIDMPITSQKVWQFLHPSSAQVGDCGP